MARVFQIFRGMTVKRVTVNLWFVEIEFGGVDAPGVVLPAAIDREERARMKAATDSPAEIEDGESFESLLRTDPAVADRLKHQRDSYVAELAVTYFVTGDGDVDAEDRQTTTWKRIRKQGLSMIIRMLDHYHQRATYDAIAGIVGGLGVTLMTGRPHCPLNSWAVRGDGKPSNYEENEIHKDLKERDQVIDNVDDLRRWLASPQ